MKRVLSSILMILLVLACVNSFAFAKQNRNGDRDQDCLVEGFCNGLSSLTGEISDIHEKGFGFELTVENFTETFWGLGPAWYWEMAEIERPKIGDTIRVEYYQALCEEEKNIAVTITNSEDQTLSLRDCATGLPWWVEVQNQVKGNTGDME